MKWAILLCATLLFFTSCATPLEDLTEHTMNEWVIHDLNIESIKRVISEVEKSAGSDSTIEVIIDGSNLRFIIKRDSN